MNDIKEQQFARIIYDKNQYRQKLLERMEKDKQELKEINRDIADLSRIYKSETGTSLLLNSERPSIAELVESVLKGSEEGLYVDDIVHKIKETHDISLLRQSVVATLVRYIKRDNTFKRVGKNVFALKQN